MESDAYAFQSDVVVRVAGPADAEAWHAMRCDLWPDGAADHAEEIAAYFAGTIEEPEEVLIAEIEGRIVGLAELSIRYDVAGFEGQQTGYVEGLYVQPDKRGDNVAQRLLQESRTWARRHDCIVFASDRADRVIVDSRFPRSPRQ